MNADGAADVERPTDDDWAAGTFVGAQDALRRDVARATPAERVAWLARAQRLAAATGALQAELDRRGAAGLARWKSGDA